MGIKVDLFKKGINYVLKSAENVTPKRISVFDGVEGSSAKKLSSVLETKVPLKQGVTNPFDSIESFSCDYLTVDERRKNVATFLKFLDSFKNGNFTSKINKDVASNVEEILLKHPLAMQTLPAGKVNLGLLNVWSKNPSSWKPEYGTIPFDKIKSQGQIEMYIKSILAFPKQAQHSFDPKTCIRTFGQKGHNGTVDVFDFSYLKQADGSYDKSKLAEFIDYIKSESGNQDLRGIKQLFADVSSKDATDNYPKAVEFILNNFADKSYPYMFPCFSPDRYAQIEKLLNSGTEFANKKCANINQLIYNASAYNFVISNPKLSVLGKEDISKFEFRFCVTIFKLQF